MFLNQLHRSIDSRDCLSKMKKKRVTVPVMTTKNDSRLPKLLGKLRKVGSYLLESVFLGVIWGILYNFVSIFLMVRLIQEG
jgi:hypothetical protein